MSVTAEHLLIGSMLLDLDARQMAQDRGIGPDSLGDRRLATILDAMVSLSERGAPVDAVTVAHETGRFGSPQTSESITALMSHVVTTGSVDHAPYYADVVVEESRVRRLNAAVDTVIDRIRRDPDGDYRPDLLAAMDTVFQAKQNPTLRWYHEAIPPYIADLQAIWNGTTENPSCPTGWRSLDRYLRGGFYPGELTIVGARPGIGKTVFGLEVAHAAARNGKRVLFFSAEMTLRAVLRRAGSEFTGIPASLTDGSMLVTHPDHLRKRESYVRLITEQMSTLPVAVDDRPRPTVAYMREQIERLGDVGLVVFDYLGLAGDAVKGDSEERRISQIATGLMHLAKVCNVPVVALCQLSREVEHQKPYVPTLSHLRYSGDIEAGAHVVLLLYRKDYYVDQQKLDPDPGKEGHLDIFVAKNREGENGLVTLKFDGPTFSIKDFEE